MPAGSHLGCILSIFVLVIVFLVLSIKKASALIFLLSNKIKITSENFFSTLKPICNAEPRQDQEKCLSNFTAALDGCNLS